MKSTFSRFAFTIIASLAIGSVGMTVHEPTASAQGNKEATQAALAKIKEGGALLKEKKYAEGAAMLDAAGAVLERELGPDAPICVNNRKLLKDIYTALKEPAKAAAVEARADALRKTWKAPVAPPPRTINANEQSAMAKMKLGMAAFLANDYPKAAELMESALPDVIKNGDEKQILMTSAILASTYDYAQMFNKGEALRKDVIARMEKLYGPDDEKVADEYESLATHYMMRADNVKTIGALKKCVELTRKRNPQSAKLADRLMTLASNEMGSDFDSAGPRLIEAMNIVKVLSPPDPLRQVRIAHFIVRLSDEQDKRGEGDQAAAVTCQIATESKKQEVLDEAFEDCLRVALVKGDKKGAGELAAGKLAKVQARFGTQGPFYAAAAHSLALVRWSEGRKEEATTLARGSAEATEKYLMRLLNASGDASKRAQINKTSAESYDLLSMGGAGNGGGPNQVSLALETIFRRKGRALDASADVARNVRLFDKSEDKALASRQIEVRRQIAALGLRGAAPPPTPSGKGGGGGGGAGGGLVDTGALLTKLEAEDDEISNKLAAASPIYRAQSKPVTLDSVKAAIPDDSALIEYVYYHARDTNDPRFMPKEVRFAAFIVHKTGDPVAVDLGDGVPIGKSVIQIRKALANRGDVLPHSKALHDLVIAPIKKHLRPSDKRLIVSPDEELNLVPYGALMDDKGQFLVSDYEIAYVTSGRDLLRIAAMNGQQSSNSKPIVIGDPAFDGSGTGTSSPASSSPSAATRAGDLGKARFRPLPGTAAEVKAITEALSASSYTQADATKMRLAGVSSPIVLHVATHGFFLPREDPVGGGDHDTRSLEYDPGTDGAPPVSVTRTENPLVRSGLALAGANNKTSADGLLTALEASSMKLDGTRLVVLSACETGVGETAVGDGVYGLRRALVVAGSQSQLMSLWKVDDEATRDMMIAFYTDLRSGTGRAAALRKVQLSMLGKKETQHPYFWAAFIPSGAWGPMDFKIQEASTVSTGVEPLDPKRKDKPNDDDDYTPSVVSGTTLAISFDYMKTTNLRDQADRTGVLLGMHLDVPVLTRLIRGGRYVGLNDGMLGAVYVGARTSDATKYPASGEEEGGLSGGLRGGYELLLGLRSGGWGAFAGGQFMYNTFVLGDVRTYGTTLPLVGVLRGHIGDTSIAIRGQYGKWIVDQETFGASLNLGFGSYFVVAGYEELKMPATVSLDGKEDRANAARQVSGIGSFAIGGYL